MRGPYGLRMTFPSAASRHESQAFPKNPFNFCATAFAVALSSRPARRSTRAGSMQAIFAVRTTDGAGRPARARLAIVTSYAHGAFSALVIIATQISPNGASLRLEMTSAGRRF